MTVVVLYEGRVRVDHHQAYLESGDAEADHDGAFEAQANGLLGAGVPGALTLSVGTALGEVGLRVVRLDAAPGDPGPEWEDVAEASFRPSAGRIEIREPTGGTPGRFELPVADHRVRLCARGIDVAWDGLVRSEDPLLDHYELVFWLAPPVPDAVVRLTSAHGIAAHRDRPRTGVTPPRPPARDDTWFARLDPALAQELSAAGPHVQRQVAYRAARRACEEVGISEIVDVAEALTALTADLPLPVLFTLPGLTAQRVGLAGERVDRALYAVLVAADDDPLDAARESVAALREVADEDDVLARVREGLAELLRTGAAHLLPDSRSPFEEEVEEESAADPGAGWSAPPLTTDDPRARYLDPRPAHELIAKLDRSFPDLLARVDLLDPARQRRAAFWVAQQCVQRAELHQLLWVNDAFIAFGQGNAPQPWAGGDEGRWLLADPRWRERKILRQGRPVPVWPLALRAVRHAVGPDPREALLLTVYSWLQAAGDAGRQDVLRGIHGLGR